MQSVAIFMHTNTDAIQRTKSNASEHQSSQHTPIMQSCRHHFNISDPVLIGLFVPLIAT
jgi:hypothetical protein